MEGLVITPIGNLVVPMSVKDILIEAFSTSKIKELEVRGREEFGEYDIYHNGKYLDTITQYKNPFNRGIKPIGLYYQ